MTDLQAILARIEAAVGPDRELDLALGIALAGWQLGDLHATGQFHPGVSTNFVRDDEGNVYVARPGGMYPSFTESIDAALALVTKVLPGWRWHIHDGNVAMLCRDWNDDYAPVFWSLASPSLAILAALLRALINTKIAAGEGE